MTLVQFDWAVLRRTLYTFSKHIIAWWTYKLCQLCWIRGHIWSHQIHNQKLPARLHHPQQRIHKSLPSLSWYFEVLCHLKNSRGNTTIRLKPSPPTTTTTTTTTNNNNNKDKKNTRSLIPFFSQTFFCFPPEESHKVLCKDMEDMESKPNSTKLSPATPLTQPSQAVWDKTQHNLRYQPIISKLYQIKSNHIPYIHATESQIQPTSDYLYHLFPSWLSTGELTREMHLENHNCQNTVTVDFFKLSP